MVQIKDVWQTFLLVVFRADIFLFVWTIRPCSLASIVNPANEIIVVVFFADAREISGEGAPLELVAFPDRVARETSPGVQQLFAMAGAASLVLGQRISERRLPQVCGDGLELLVVETEIGHFSGGAEGAGLLQPNRNPILVELEPNLFEIGANFLHVLQEAFVRAIELNDAQVKFAVGDFEGDGAIIEAIGVFVGLGGVGLLHEVVGLLEVIFLFLLDELDLLGDGEEVFGFFVVAFVAMAAHAAALTEEILALRESPANIIGHQHHIRGVTVLATGFHISPGE